MRKGRFFFELGSAQRCHHLGYEKCYFCRKRVCFFTKGCRSKRVGILIYYIGKGYFLTGHSDKGSGTPWPKTISARDSSAQIDIFTGTPRPGTPRPRIKILYLWHIMENKCISSMFLFQYMI